MAFGQGGDNIVPRTIRDTDKHRWRGYLASDNLQVERSPLTVDEVRSRARAWMGTSINPENPKMEATISEVTHQSVVLDLPGGTRHYVPFQEIIDADAVLRYWLARDESPVSDDFRHPDPAIREVQGRGISNNSYAPALAERMRRSGEFAEHFELPNQVRFPNRMSISDFFKNTLGANLSNARWSWGAYNANMNQLFLRVWDDHLETVDGTERISILRTDWEGTSAGFPERKRHVEALRNGAEGYGVLCTAKDIHSPKGRTIGEFDSRTLLKFGQIIDEGPRVYAQIVDHIPVEDVARPQTAQSSVVPDLRSIFSAKRVDATTKELLANARVGQGAFRARVLALWGSQCCVTGSTTLNAIRASHIKPWRDSTDDERLDEYNGLPLIATLDALFDAGLITFTPDGTLLASNHLTPNEQRLLGLTKCKLRRQPNDQTADYLAYHRDAVFIDTQKRQHRRLG